MSKAFQLHQSLKVAKSPMKTYSEVRPREHFGTDVIHYFLLYIIVGVPNKPRTANL